MTPENGWTSHGHPIPWVDQKGPRPKNVMRCGGVKICSVCQREALGELRVKGGVEE